MQKIIGVSFLIIGLGVLLWGHSLAGAHDATVENLANGTTTNRSTYVYIGGGIFIVYGLVRLTLNRK